MKQWIYRFIMPFRNKEILPREARQEILLRYLIWITLLLLVVVIPFKIKEWITSPTQTNLFFLISCVLCEIVLLLVAYLNRIHHVKTSAAVYLLLSYYLCFIITPLHNPNQLLLYATFPTIISSLITHENNSVLFTLIGLVFFGMAYNRLFPSTPFPYFSCLCLFLVALFAMLITHTIEQTIEQVKIAYEKTIQGWSQILEMRNKETEGHSQRVVELTLKLVKKMRVDESRWAHIRRGVLLHDIGKMGVPDMILCKAGPLTDSELLIMQNHPNYARDLLQNIPFLEPALEIPYCHHEKWDGTGYPRGLRGTEIPLEARIFSIVDVWDAMRSERSYRGEISEVQVIDYLQSESGHSFDPEVVKAFFEMMDFTLAKTSSDTALILNQQPQK